MKQKKIQNDSENKRIMKEAVYHEFVTWFSVPTKLRIQTGIEDQNQFAEYYGVSKDTLSLWKKRPDFNKKVDRIRDSWAHEKTMPIFEAIFKSAVKGNAASQRLWMKVFWGNKFDKKEEPLLSVEDIRFLINQLSEPLQAKYNMFLRDLSEDCRRYIEEEGLEDIVNPPPKKQPKIEMTDEEYANSL